MQALHHFISMSYRSCLELLLPCQESAAVNRPSVTSTPILQSSVHELSAFFLLKRLWRSVRLIMGF